MVLGDLQSGQGHSMKHSRRHRQPALLAFLAASACLLLGGCAQTVFGTRKPLDVTGPISVDVVTFAGEVTIQATGDAPGEPYVYVRPRATHSIHRMGDAQASLDDIDWSIETLEEGGRTVLRIRATTLYPESGLQRLHVTVSAPHIDGVNVSTTLGDVDLSEVEGPISVETTRGDVSIVTGRPLAEAVSVTTTDGDITFRAPPGTSGRLDAFTADGRVVCSVRDEKFRVHGFSNDQSMQGVINDGQSPLVFRTNDGTIRIVVKKHPHQQASFLFD